MKNFNIILHGVPEHFPLVIGNMDEHFNLVLPNNNVYLGSLVVDGLVSSVTINGESSMILSVSSEGLDVLLNMTQTFDFELDTTVDATPTVTQLVRVDASAGVLEAIMSALVYVFCEGTSSEFALAMDAAGVSNTVMTNGAPIDMEIDMSTPTATVMTGLAGDQQMVIETAVAQVVQYIYAGGSADMEICSACTETVRNYFVPQEVDAEVICSTPKATLVLLSVISDWTDFTLAELADMTLEETIYTEVM